MWMMMMIIIIIIVIVIIMYWCDTWSLTLREDCGLKVFENRVLRGIFETKMDEVTRE
jgi:hypothetical protein